MAGKKVFISYSHQDKFFIEPVVKLVRGLKKNLVFQDVTELQPGVKWQQVLNEEISNCEVFLLFWCFHSAESAEVKKEWVMALEHNKSIWPLLLDSTNLPPELSQFQWIDMAQFANHPHPDARDEIIIGMDTTPDIAELITNLLDRII